MMENTTTSTRYIPFDRALHSSNALFVKQCYCNTVNETELFISRLVNYIKSIVYCNVSEETNMNIGIIITANTINCVQRPLLNYYSSVLFEEQLLEGFSNWLDRLFDGNTHRYTINYWPDWPGK